MDKQIGQYHKVWFNDDYDTVHGLILFVDDAAGFTGGFRIDNPKVARCVKLAAEETIDYIDFLEKRVGHLENTVRDMRVMCDELRNKERSGE